MTRATRRLSARKVETIKKPGYHADGEGLYLVVDQSGARRWAFIYHTRGKRREMGLGRMGLKEAREAAEEVRRQIRKGIDPITARRHDRSNKASIPTFEAIAAEVIADAQERSTNDKVRYQWELLLGPRYCNSLLQKPINQITTLDIEQVLRPVWRKQARNRSQATGALAPSLRLCPCSPTGPARHRYAEQPGCLAGSAGPRV